MAQWLDQFMQSYVKNLKRPELLNFSPDGAFGANMVHGSENQNPWANRNNENAKYGMLGGTQPLKQVVTQPTTTGTIANIPGLGAGPTASPAQGTFNNLMAATAAPATTIGANWLAGSGVEKLKELFGGTANKTIEESTSRAMEHMLNGTTPLTTTEQAVSNFIEGTPAKSVVEKAVENLGTKAVEEGTKTGATIPSGFDPTSLGVSMVDPIARTLTGSKTLGSGLGAAATTGMAAAQGFMNPVSDIAALVSLIKFGSRLFG